MSHTLCILALRYNDHEDRVFNRAISDISVVSSKTAQTISDSFETVTGLPSRIRNSESGFPLLNGNNRDNTTLKTKR